MSASIKIKYYRSEIEAGLQSYDLRVVAVSAIDMPKEIFVFQHATAPPPTVDEEATDPFICLADPVDLEEMPVNSPDLANEMPFYRTDETTLRFRDMATLAEVRALIDEDITALVNALNAAETLPVFEEEDYV